MQRVKVGQTGLRLGEISDTNPFIGYTSKEARHQKLYATFLPGEMPGLTRVI